uniref:Uncharacterized protein n=1 Tax=Papio anubis TaxID=9555 RepID=A0A2I3N9F9_PAPAN
MGKCTSLTYCSPKSRPHPLSLGCEASWRYRYPSLQCCCQPFLWKPNGYDRGGVGQALDGQGKRRKNERNPADKKVKLSWDQGP